MGRLVDPKPAGGALFAEEDKKDQAKEAAERIAKYVPGEVLAAYLGVVAIVDAAYAKPGPGRAWGLFAAVVVGFVFTPLYLRRMAEPGQPRRLHMAVGTGSFLAWSYTTKGWWEYIGWYNGVAAGIGIIVLSLLSGLLAPTQGSK
ncbi:MAG: hypothetical protein U0Q22_03750 [Acidimicrobiales bacterium]